METEKEENKIEKRSNDEFFAMVSALTRFIETADNDLAPVIQND